MFTERRNEEVVEEKERRMEEEDEYDTWVPRRGEGEDGKLTGDRMVLIL